MGKRRFHGGGPKNPYADIPMEWRDAVCMLDPDQIRGRIAETILNQQEMLRAKKKDPDLREKKERLDAAAEKYKDGTTMNALQSKLLLPPAKSSDDAKKQLANLALAQEELMSEKELDPEYTSAKAAYEGVNADYSEGTKINKLKIKYCRKVLRDKGAL